MNVHRIWSYTISDNYRNIELTVLVEEMDLDERVDEEGYQSTVSAESERGG